MRLSLQKLEMTDFMKKDVIMSSSHCEPVKLIYDFKSKGVKGKYIDAVSLILQ